MSAPRPLIEDTDDDLELELLRSARDDAPSPEARARVVASLGLATAATAATAVTAVTAAGTAAGATAAKTGVAAAGAAASKLALLPWIAVTVVAGSAAVVAVGGASTSRPAETVASAPAATAIAPAKSALAPRAPIAALPAAPVEAPSASASVPAPPSAAPAPKPIVPLPAKPPIEKPSLAEEVKSLDDVSALLKGGDPGAALAALDAHDRAFAHGVLRPEATALRVEALVKKGNVDAARAIGQAFLAKHPSGAAARRVRTVLDIQDEQKITNP